LSNGSFLPSVGGRTHRPGAERRPGQGVHARLGPPPPHRPRQGCQGSRLGPLHDAGGDKAGEANQLRRIVREEEGRGGMKVKVVERAGIKLSFLLPGLKALWCKALLIPPLSSKSEI